MHDGLMHQTGRAQSHLLPGLLAAWRRGPLCKPALRVTNASTRGCPHLMKAIPKLASNVRAFLSAFRAAGVRPCWCRALTRAWFFLTKLCICACISGCRKVTSVELGDDLLQAVLHAADASRCKWDQLSSANLLHRQWRGEVFTTCNGLGKEQA